MPFRKRARVEFVNEGDNPCKQYLYIDYETYRDVDALGPDPAYLHADFRMERPFGGWGPDLASNSPEVDGVRLLGREAWDNNYVLTEAKGRGHYVGCFFNVVNLQATTFRGLNDPSYSWWGEGDEMIWVDGYSWPPDLHGTGSEDYFNHALGMQRNAFLRNGASVHECDTDGFSTSYVCHVENTVRFQKELKATMEIGHANHLGNDISSVAFFYLDRPAGVTRPPSAEVRRPLRRVRGKWQLTSRNWHFTRAVPVDEGKRRGVDQWRRREASEFWVASVGRLFKDGQGEYLFADRKSTNSHSLKELLRDMAETAASCRSPLVLLDLFGAEAAVQLSPAYVLPEACLASLEANLDKVVKITAGALLQEEKGNHPEAACKVTMHARITFRD
jgi:hypothetical protein